MSQFSLILTVLSLGLVLQARADEWTRTYQVNGVPDLKISTSDAGVDIQAWDKDSIEVRVITENIKINQEDGLRVTDHQSGNEVTIEVREPHGFFHFGIGRKREQVRVNVPRKANLHIQTSDGHIQVSGVTGNLDLNAGDGHIEADGVSGNLRGKAGDGRIHVKGRFDQLDLTTGDGSIEAIVLPGSHIATSWTLHTGDGRLNVHLPVNFAANLDVRTGDGHITVGLPVTISGRNKSNTLRGTLNGGGGLLTLHTGDGSIHLDGGNDTI